MIPQIYYVIAIGVILVTASWHLSSALTKLQQQMATLQLEIAKSTGNNLQFAKDLGGLEARVTLLERNKQ